MRDTSPIPRLVLGGTDSVTVRHNLWLSLKLLHRCEKHHTQVKERNFTKQVYFMLNNTNSVTTLHHMCVISIWSLIADCHRLKKPYNMLLYKLLQPPAKITHKNRFIYMGYLPYAITKLVSINYDKYTYICCTQSSVQKYTDEGQN